MFVVCYKNLCEVEKDLMKLSDFIASILSAHSTQQPNIYSRSLQNLTKFKYMQQSDVSR